jgi:carbohydrate-selective porin OprB
MPVAMLLGIALDSTLAASDLVAYASAVPSPHAAPVWIIAIWAAFALTLRHSFRFLHGRRVLAAALGAIGAPLAYLGAARGWHAVAFPRGTTAALIALGIGWLVAMPALITLAQHFELRQATSSTGNRVHVA